MSVELSSFSNQYSPQLFNPVVQIYDLTTWPPHLRLLSPLHLLVFLLLSLVLAVSACILYPAGQTIPSLLCILLSLTILAVLAVLAVSVFLQRKGGAARLKVRV